MRFIFPHQFKMLSAHEKFAIMKEIAKGKCMLVYSKKQAMFEALKRIGG